MEGTIWFIIGLAGLIFIIWLFLYVIVTHKPAKEMSEKELDNALKHYSRDLGYEDEIIETSYNDYEIEAIDNEFIQYKDPDLVFDKELNKYVDYKETPTKDTKTN